VISKRKCSPGFAKPGACGEKPLGVAIMPDIVCHFHPPGEAPQTGKHDLNKPTWNGWGAFTCGLRFKTKYMQFLRVLARQVFGWNHKKNSSVSAIIFLLKNTKIVSIGWNLLRNFLPSSLAQ
jgi:hypothetical protein